MIMTAVNNVVGSEIMAVVSMCPRPLLNQVCQTLRECCPQAAPDDILTRLPSTNNAELARSVEALMTKIPGVMTWESLGCSLEAAAFVLDAERQAHQVDLVWSGPSSGLLGVRRIDQVLYDLIASAKKQITLATFAAAKIQKLNSVLVEAVIQGVMVALIRKRK